MLKLEIEIPHKENEINFKRLRFLNNLSYQKGSIVYWMQREQRVYDNWALLYAQYLAIENNEPLVVVFSLDGNNINTLRQYDFMVQGLKQIEKLLAKKNIPFYVLKSSFSKNIHTFLKENNAGALVTDFNPLKFKRNLEDEVSKKLAIPFICVDSHNICPCFSVSDKKEYGARTIRLKIQRSLIEFLTEFPKLKKMPECDSNQNNWAEIYKNQNLDASVKPFEEVASGEYEAQKMLEDFIENKLNSYDKRNDPNEEVCSNLSGYLHFGQISSQRVALEVIKSNASVQNKEAFLEELIVRKELADNYCFYNENYDSVKGFDNWALISLEKHKNDIRAYVYTQKELENGQTHDELWNAAQMQMVKKGKMHGYLRMYWAKKILEWTPDYKMAFDIAIYLNDKYELDGCDSNGYVGVAWSIGGVHDRAWSEREIFGKIRYMNFNGCKRKFDIFRYITEIKML